jgi:hypothetical protein
VVVAEQDAIEPPVERRLLDLELVHVPQARAGDVSATCASSRSVASPPAGP